MLLATVDKLDILLHFGAYTTDPHHMGLSFGTTVPHHGSGTLIVSSYRLSMLLI